MKSKICEVCEEREATEKFRSIVVCSICEELCERVEKEERGTNLEDYEEYDEEDCVIPKKENPDDGEDIQQKMCEWCGDRPATVKGRTNKFCSVSCAAKSRYHDKGISPGGRKVKEKPVIMCQWCNEKPVKKGSKNFCSYEHYLDWEDSRKVRKECLECGQLYTTRTTTAINQKYCSKSCQTKAANKKAVEVIKSKPKKLQALCQKCGVNRVSHVSHKFCSKACAKESMKEQRIARAKLWYGRKKSNPIPSEYNFASYQRVVPRDLFNEAKLLKCLGKVSVGIFDGKIGGLGLVEKFTDEKKGFKIVQNEDGDIMCDNYRLFKNGHEIYLFSRLNSKANWPLMTIDHNNDYIDVFEDDGSFTDEFKNYLKNL